MSRGGERHRLVLAAACMGALIVSAGAAFSQGKPAGEVLLQAGFEEGAAGWRQEGKADFGLDPTQHHGGDRSLRITIRPDDVPHWQQWQREFRDVSHGDAFEASVWIRTRGVAEGVGAYFVLEYLDADRKRCGIDHSRFGPDIGAKEWDKLTIHGRPTEGTQTLRVGLILNSHGTAWFDDLELVRTETAAPWPDLGTAERQVTVHTREVVQPRFGGVGFHVFHHTFTMAPEHLDQVVAKRWRELDPSFARLNDCWDWDRAMLDRVAAHMLRFKATGTELYVATWNPKDVQGADDLAAYARRVVDNLEYYVRTKGVTNLKTYCMSNELSLKGWGALLRDLPRFRDYHRALHAELKARKLDVQLLATDASPIGNWGTIQWAAEHMDDITGIYGAHHYINDRALDDERFYPWFLGRTQWAVGLARDKGKGFILGEFGCKQDGRTIGGKRMDACVYWGTPQEPLVAIQLCEAAIAAINAGVVALGNWTFMDFPDDYSRTYANKWGTFKWSGTDYATRPHYYAYGLLSKFFRGPAAVLKVDGNDPRLRVAAVRHLGADTWSIAVVNRNKAAVRVAIGLDGLPLAAAFRKYVYDPASVPSNPFGDLQDPSGKVAMSEGRLADTVGAGTLTVYTTAFDEEPPAPVKGLAVEKAPDGRRTLTWQANAEPDLCYYRVYRSDRPGFVPSLATQIASTVATSFVDRQAAADAETAYKIIAVDQSGNPSRSE